MTKYAADTSVPSDRSRAEIEKTLARYGASQFAYGWNQDNAMIGFVAEGRQVRFVLPMPDKTARQFTHTPGRNLVRTADQVEQVYEQAVRQRWRALALVVKAKLEAVETGIVTFEQEFAMHMVLPNGSTVGEWVAPQIEEAYATGKMPPMLQIEGKR
jgi:hypothetical protein